MASASACRPAGFTATPSRARDEKRLLADEAARDAQNVDKLRLGRLDYLIGIRESIAALNQGELEEAGILASNLTYIALPDSPRSRALLLQLNPHIADLPDKARAP
jgi:polar amino acid transport system substrate-binding protein